MVLQQITQTNLSYGPFILVITEANGHIHTIMPEGGFPTKKDALAYIEQFKDSMSEDTPPQPYFGFKFFISGLRDTTSFNRYCSF